MLGIATKVKTVLAQIKWRRKYKGDNGLIPKNPFPMNIVVPGIHSYGELNIVSFNRKSKLYIGNYVSIAQNVTFLIDADHFLNHISTYPFRTKILQSSEQEAISKGDIIIDDDVWIGYGSIILSGVHVGQGAVVAAGSVVAKDVPPYAIVAGAPANIVKYRFSKDISERLLKLDYSKLNEKNISDHIQDLYETVTPDTDLSWLPIK